MRLLHTDTLEISQFHQIPPYAILSHTWGDDGEDVTYEDIRDKVLTTGKPGYSKIKNTCLRAAEDGLDHVWIDSCCIDKSSSAELSEALNSMYAWYQEAEVCYVYLVDVPHGSDRSVISKSRWFTRGWTLQELIAPSDVIFLDNEWREIGTKSDLREVISEITGIPVNILLGDDPGQASIAQRMSWAASRVTKRIEDRAYSLMGLFGVNMPMLYGERERAFIRLQEEIMKASNDHSIFAWMSPETNSGPLASSPNAFADSRDIVLVDALNTFDNHATVTSQGIQLTVPFMGVGQEAVGLAMLNCARSSRPGWFIAIYLRDISLTMRNFERVRCEELKLVNPKSFNPLIYPSREMYIRNNRPKIKVIPERSEICVLDLQGIRTNNLHFHAAWELSNGTLAAAIPKIDDTICGRILVSSTDGAWSRILLRRSEGRLSAEVSSIEPQRQSETGDITQRVSSQKRLSVAIQKKLRQNNLFWTVRIGHAPPESDPYEGIQFSQMMVLDRASEDEELLFAASHGVEQIVKLLIAQKDVKMNCKDSLGALIARAAEGGHLNVVRLLLEIGAQPESFDIERRSPIHYAAANGHTDIVSLLLARGVNVNLKDKDLWTPLAHAAARGQDLMVQLFLSRSDTSIDIHDKYRRTPLLQAAREGHLEIVKMLLGSGSDPNSEDQDGMTPLLFAARNGHEVILKELFNTGKVHINLAGEKGRPLLQLAAENGRTEVLRMLFATGKADPLFHRAKLSGLPLQLAAKHGHASVIRELLDTQPLDRKDGAGLLQVAASNGHAAVVRELLATKGIIMHTRYENENTLLHLAAENGHKDVVKELLTDIRVDPDSKNKEGKTPLHAAARHSHIEVIQELLATGRTYADCKDNVGMTPLQLAACHGNQWVVWLLLIRKDVDANYEHSRGMTPLRLAAKNGHAAVTRLLLAIGMVDADVQDLEGKTPFWCAVVYGHHKVIREFLKVGKGDLDSTNGSRYPAVWHAALYGKAAVFEELLNVGEVNLESTPASKWTLLHLAVIHGRKYSVELLLTKAKVNPQPEDNEKKTPLWFAANLGHYEIVEDLLEIGKCNPSCEDKDKTTPLHMAAAKGHKEIVRKLLATGQVNPWAKDSAGKTPISLAKRNGFRGIVEEFSRIDTAGPRYENSGNTSLSRQVSEDKHQEVMEKPLETNMANAVGKRMLIRNIFNKNKK